MWRTLPRIWKHRWLDSRAAQRALPPDALARLAAQVAQSEAGHTGEIRIAAESGLPWSYLRRQASPRERAMTLFGKLRVWDTQDNNGVLIYLLLAEHAVELVADRGYTPPCPLIFGRSCWRKFALLWRHSNTKLPWLARLALWMQPWPSTFPCLRDKAAAIPCLMRLCCCDSAA